MIVVADTSPLNYLIQIDQVEVLPRLFSRVLIPEAVSDELSDSRAPEVVRAWISDPPLWFEVRTIEGVILQGDLDRGETEAIELAQRIDAPLLIDDRLGRVCAVERGLKVIGTLGVIDEAGRLGLLDFQEAIRRLQNTIFHIAKQTLAAFLAKRSSS